MGEFRGTKQIISAKQNQNIKALTGASSILNIWRENRAVVLTPKQEMAIYSLLQRIDVMEILSIGFGKSMIFTVFAKKVPSVWKLELVLLLAPFCEQNFDLVEKRQKNAKIVVLTNSLYILVNVFT